MIRRWNLLSGLFIVGIALLGAAARSSFAADRTANTHLTSTEAASISNTTKWLSTLTQEDDRLISKIRVFLGKERNANSGQEGIVAEQVIEHIAVPSEPFAVRLPDGNWLATGNYPRAGDAKGAILIDRSGAVRAVVLIDLEIKGETVSDEMWIYVADDQPADAYITDIKRWPDAPTKYTMKIFRLGKKNN